MNMEDVKAIISLNGMCPSTIKWRMTDDCNYDCSYCIRKITKWREHQSLDNYKKDEENCLSICSEVARVIKELPGWVKLDLIGGEPSLLDLHSILEKLFKECGEKLKRVNLTTNMTMSADYYNDLTQLCYNYGSEIGITCSWHGDFISLDEFIEKFSKIKSPTNQKGIRIEAVSRVNNQEEIQRLIDICEKNNYSYFIERDFFADKKIQPTLICKASKQKKDRYKIITWSDEELLFKTRNEFLTSDTYDTPYPTYKCSPYYCSRDYDYVYIEYTNHMGRVSNPENCKDLQPLANFHPLREPLKCAKTIDGYCTLCGQISLSKEVDLLKKE